MTSLCWSRNGRYLLSGHARPGKGKSDSRAADKPKAEDRVVLWDVQAGTQVRGGRQTVRMAAAKCGVRESGAASDAGWPPAAAAAARSNLREPELPAACCLCSMLLAAAQRADAIGRDAGVPQRAQAVCGSGVTQGGAPCAGGLVQGFRCHHTTGRHRPHRYTSCALVAACFFVQGVGDAARTKRL